MSISSAIEFGRLLKLTQGIDARPVNIVSETETNLAQAVVKRINKTSRYALNPFCNELAALYLPCLLRTFTQIPILPFPFDPEDERWFVYGSAVAGVAPTPSFARFVRERWHDVCELLVGMGESLANLPSFGLELPPATIAIVARMFETFLEVMSGIKFTAVPGSLLPPLQPALKRKIQRLLPSFACGIIYPHAFDLLQTFVGGEIDLDYNRDALTKKGTYFVWWFCEGTNDGKAGSRAASKDEKCASLKAGGDDSLHSMLERAILFARTPNGRFGETQGILHPSQLVNISLGRAGGSGEVASPLYCYRTYEVFGEG